MKHTGVNLGWWARGLSSLSQSGWPFPWLTQCQNGQIEGVRRWSIYVCIVIVPQSSHSQMTIDFFLPALSIPSYIMIESSFLNLGTRQSSFHLSFTTRGTCSFPVHLQIKDSIHRSKSLVSNHPLSNGGKSMQMEAVFVFLHHSNKASYVQNDDYNLLWQKELVGALQRLEHTLFVQFPAGLSFRAALRPLICLPFLRTHTPRCAMWGSAGLVS